MRSIRSYSLAIGVASIIVGLLLLVVPVSSKSGMIFSSSAAKASGSGGPIVLDGMDPVCHAVYGEGTENYIAKVVKSVYDQSAYPSNNNKIAILGIANPSSAGGCGGNWESMLTNDFLVGFDTQPTVQFVTTSAELDAFFAGISSDAPRMIWIPDDWSRSSAISDKFTANAEVIADFVNSGGGLFANYGTYGWLTTLLPGATFNDGGCNGGPVATADGATDFGLTNDDVEACWHGSFSGDVGTLKTLAEWRYPNASTSPFVSVSIGGGSVSLPSSFMLAVSPENPEAGDTLTITATAQLLDGTPQEGVEISMTVSSGPDAGQTFTATTDATGIATFSISTSSVGSNTYTATATVNGILKTVSVTTTWSPPSSTAPTTTEAPTTTAAPAPVPAPTPVYSVSLDMGEGSCTILGDEKTGEFTQVFIGYLYIPGPEECSREGYMMNGWAHSTDATTSAGLPLLTDPTDGVKRHFIASDMVLVAIWEEIPAPETTAPEAPTTTVHDHSSHDHGALPKTGSNIRLNLAIGFVLVGALVLFIMPRKREIGN